MPQTYICVKNSWGQDAGDKNLPGYYYIPEEYFTNGNCMGGWIYSLEPKGFTVSLLTQIVNLMQNIISKLQGK